MIIKAPISFDRNLPSYVFKYNVSLICFVSVWVVSCVAAMILIGSDFGENTKTYITISVLFAVFVIGLLIFYAVALKLRGRLIDEYAAELEVRFADMPVDDAVKSLKEREIITDNGFLFKKDNFCGGEVVPFNKVELLIWGQTHEDVNCGRSVKRKLLPKIEIVADMYVYNENDDDGLEQTIPLDRELFNFLAKCSGRLNIETDSDLEFLKNDKKNFCRRSFGFRVKKN